MKRNHILGAAIALGVFASGAILGPKLVSAADPLGPPPAGDEMAANDMGPDGSGHPGGKGPHQHMFMHHHGPGEHLDGKLAFLKAELKLQPSQDKAWGNFEAAVRKSVKSLEAKRAQAHPNKSEMDKGEWKPPTAPERLDRMEAMLNARLDALRTVKSETKALYAALSPEQQKTFDELDMERMHHRM